MRSFTLLMLFCMSMVVACGTTGPTFGQPGASVVKTSYAPAGVYTFNFKRDEIYTLATVRADAIKKYLEQHQQLLPPNCSLGVQVLDVVDGESDDSVASFSCKTAPIQRRQVPIEYRNLMP